MNEPLSQWTQWRDLAQWLMSHYRARAKETSVYAVAKRLRKQGIPLWAALLILCGRKP